MAMNLNGIYWVFTMDKLACSLGEINKYIIE